MSQLHAVILTIGDELLIGQTIDTNSAFIAQELNRIGIWVKRRIAVGDIREEILDALQTQSRDNQLIIITGGLGPTADDITKPALCEYFASDLVEDAGVLDHVRALFTRMNRPMTVRNEQQALVPRCCTVLHNERGTAPGMWFEKEGVLYVSLPGVPHEMKGLIQSLVIPKLKEKLSLPAIGHRTLLTAGQGESTIADALSGFEAGLPAHIKLAYLPAYGMVRLRLTGRSDDATRLHTELDEQFQKLQDTVGDWMIASEDIGLPEIVRRQLEAAGKTLCTAESCTGGYIAHLITSLAGSSSVYQGSVVAYANSVKQSVLGVAEDTLQSDGAVSEAVVRQMVAGALRATGADYVVATSGIMGPGGGTPDKPVGTVWMAVGSTEKTITARHHFRFDRQRNIEQTALTALLLLRRLLVEDNPAG